MIVGLIGSICSGKETLAKYLVEEYGFEAINILDLFRERIAEEMKKQTKNGPSEEECI
jgi:dephospho-CoA kinase